MPFSLYEITVPVFIHGLKTLSHLLDVGTEQVKFDGESKLITSRLVEDQGDLVFQVQKASDAARLLVVRLVKFDGESKLITSRLVEDQGDLVFQVQKASDAARLLVVRLGKVESATFANDEATFEQLHARISETIKFLESVDPKQIDQAESDIIEWNGQKLIGSAYAVQFAIPNFYFHLTTAYSILRKDGVQIGKADFLGKKN
ncbi:hypothetical protein BP6252_05930 [Coleophoma cylindrospora]|uniref:DUF1993 domain-containing protein n=1 Tax=Coleophoma cylindrospora TaxID=1849047 RepID=A0A3D8RLF2_9HELO|nr:hypothetical protein BP6252_05930 [Coleophoma cylindrospora]